MNRHTDSDHHSIVIDEEVFGELQKRATPLVDDANDVIRQLLELPPLVNGPLGADRAQPRAQAAETRLPPGPRQAKARSSRSKKKPPSKRAPKGSLLPEEEYERPLLEALVELGGAAPSAKVIDRVGTKVEEQLTKLDHETIGSGDLRWRSRTQFVRLDLVKRGLMAKDSPRGTWEITDQGRDLIAQDRADD